MFRNTATYAAANPDRKRLGKVRMTPRGVPTMRAVDQEQRDNATVHCRPTSSQPRYVVSPDGTGCRKIDQFQ